MPAVLETGPMLAELSVSFGVAVLLGLTKSFL